MVEFSSVKVTPDSKLILRGERTCVLLDQKEGEFSNARTGGHVEIEVQLNPDQLTMQAIVLLLQRILLNKNDHLADLVPSYWANCVSRKVDRRDKHSPWECAVTDKQKVPDFADKKVSWDLPSPDTSLHNGSRRYLIRHRVEYLAEPGVKAPALGVAPDPIFQWEQERIHIGFMALVLAFTVGEDGRARDIFIVSPIGMGIDDDAVQTLRSWQFKPVMFGEAPHQIHARVTFEIEPMRSNWQQ